MVKVRKRRTTLTAEEFFHLATYDRCYELVKGELYEMTPAGAAHGSSAMRAGALLNVHVRANQLGEVFAAETGFILRRNPDTVRAPDAAFVSRDRLPTGELPVGFLELAPDLAVEVVSPGNTAREVQEKVEDWLRAGTRLLWVLYPATRSVAVHRSLEDVRVLSEEDALEGGEVIPGFACEVRELFS